MKPPSVVHFVWTATVTYLIFGVAGCQRSDQNGTGGIPSPAEGDTARLENDRLAREVKDYVVLYSREGGDARDLKEAIGAMAAVVGERCIDATGNYPWRNHKFVPGQRIFSDQINCLLAGDNPTADLVGVPTDSVFGTIRDHLPKSRFRPADFPHPKDIFGGFASRIGDPDDWGKVPLSVPRDYWPAKLPLRVTFDTRAGVDRVLAAVCDDKKRCVQICAMALALLLIDAGENVEPKLALALSFETINGIAKTAPMIGTAINEPTPAMRKAQQVVLQIGKR